MPNSVKMQSAPLIPEDVKKIDTNVFLDYWLEREEFFDDARKIVSACATDDAKGVLQ